MIPHTAPKRFKFARAVTWLFFVLSALLLGYIYLRAHLQGVATFQGFVKHPLLKYSFVSLIGIVFWGVVLRLKDEIKLNIVILATSLITGCYLIEIVLGVLAPDQYERKYDNQNLRFVPVEYDTRNKLDVWLDLKSKGMDVVPWVSPSSNFLASNGIPGVSPSLFPLSSVSSKTILYCNESGDFVTYSSDRHGFRNPDSEWESSQTKWVLTGDSFSLGACVQRGEDIGGQIRLLTGESVLNLAPGGGSLLHQLASLQEYAAYRKPKIVLLAFFEGNDIDDFEKEVSTPILMGYLQPGFSQRLIHRQTEIDNRLNQYILKSKIAHEKNEVAALDVNRSFSGFNSFVKKTRLLRLYNIRRRLGVDTTQRKLIVHPLFSEILTKARDRVAAWGGKLYFVYLPEFARYQQHTKYLNLSKRNSSVVNVVKDLKIPIIHIHQKVFANHPDPLSLFPFRGKAHFSIHYNAKGYSEVAKAIISGVRTEQKSRNINPGK